ncbi:zinc-finger of the MIZ type in Nse subunit-domain-containing protein [Aspergillus unguis]
MYSTPGRPSRGPSNPTSISSSRHRGAAATATPRASRESTPPLPDYELPIAPLTDSGRQALLTLLRSQALRQLKTHIQHVEAKLTDSAGEVNERLTEAKVRAKKRRERAAGQDGTEARDREGTGEAGGAADTDGAGGQWEESAKVRDLEESVKAVTGRLDESMRRAIDSGVRVEGLEHVLNGLQGEAEAAANANTQRQRRKRRRREVEEEEAEDEGEERGLYDASPEPEVDREELSLRRKLEKGVYENQAKWEDLSLTDRYTTNNDYIGFYRIIHEAKYPGDDMPPVPHASTWFAHLEDPRASTRPSHDAASSRNQNRPRSTSNGSDSDDLAIARERVTFKCPLTLLPFRDPVTSTKCPHSFEREAIEGMIGQSSLTVPRGPSASGRGSRRIRAVKCPVCSEVLTNNDLREDPVLLRRVRRAEAASKREREEEEEAELGLSSARKRNRKGEIMLGSDDDPAQHGSGPDSMQVDNVRIKEERARSRGVTELTQTEQGEENGALATESETQDSEGSDILDNEAEEDSNESSNECSDEEMED